MSLCPELDIASQGDTIEEARANLVEALELFFEVADESEITRRLSGDSDEMRAEYDFSGGVRGKYTERYAKGTNALLLDPDIAEVDASFRSAARQIGGLIRARRKVR